MIIVNTKHLSAMAAALFLSVVVGCTGKSGVDAEDVTQGGPRKTRQIEAEERVKIAIKWLEEAESDPATNHKMTGHFLTLAVNGAAAESAIPVLEKIEAEWDDENVRASARRTIDKINEALAEQKDQ